MNQQEQLQRDWLYLLPGGQRAENMKSGRIILSEQSGHNFSSETFRHLVKKGVIKKINRMETSMTPPSDANFDSKTAA